MPINRIFKQVTSNLNERASVWVSRKWNYKESVAMPLDVYQIIDIHMS